MNADSGRPSHDIDHGQTSGDGAGTAGETEGAPSRRSISRRSVLALTGAAGLVAGYGLVESQAAASIGRGLRAASPIPLAPSPPTTVGTPTTVGFPIAAGSPIAAPFPPLLPTLVAPPTTTDPSTPSTPTTAPGPPTTPSPSTTVPDPNPDPGPPVGDLETHVINRLSFGPTTALRAELAAIGVDAWIEQQLNPQGLPDPEGERVTAMFPTLSASTKQNAERGRSEIPALDELRHSLTLRAVRSTRQLYEVMVHFWNDHFNVNFLVTEDFYHHETDRTVARAHALGTFRDLLRASAHSPAMLTYLDNKSSNANSELGVNENWARELLELHTLGILDGQQVYNEADVRGVAYIMSGWSLEDYAFVFRSDWHYRSAVSILDGSVNVPAGSGYEHGVALLDTLATHPSTARHLATKLVRRFVADDPPPDLVASTAQVYLSNDTAIVPVLRHIFASSHFRTGGSAKVKRPFELLMSMFRILDVDIPDSAGSTNGHVIPWVVSGALDEMGLEPFTWPAPNGPPDTAPYWLAANPMLKRWRYAGQLTFGYLAPLTVDLNALLPATRPSSAGALVDALAIRILGYPAPATERAALLDFLGLGAESPISAERTQSSLRHLVGLVLALPTFQLR